MMNRITNWFKTIIHIDSSKQELKEEIEESERRIEKKLLDIDQEVKAGFTEIREKEFDRVFARLTGEADKLERLKYVLSATPTVWGDESRLDISEKAAVNPCLFNTNSGRITVGDYTFAGSGVSILAGSHDPVTTGFIRRDSEYREGFDIKIGKGVWIGSNSTILGPCVIEDDAVIAAGAVIVPGTHVGKSELFAGIPAKKVRRLDTIERLEDDADKLAEIVAREKGVLFYSGWEEKNIVVRGADTFHGHWNDRNRTEIYTDRDSLRLIIITDNSKEGTARIILENGDAQTVNTGYEPTTVELQPGKTEKPSKILIETEGQIFVSCRDN